MTSHYPADLGSIVMPHQRHQTSFCRETSGDVAKGWLQTHASNHLFRGKNVNGSWKSSLTYFNSEINQFEIKMTNDNRQILRL